MTTMDQGGQSRAVTILARLDRLPGTRTLGQPWASGHPAGWPA